MEGADQLAMQLARELATLKGEEAHRLCGILRGLLTCLQEMDGRLKALESQSGVPTTYLARPTPPCAIRNWHLPL